MSCLTDVSRHVLVIVILFVVSACGSVATRSAPTARPNTITPLGTATFVQSPTTPSPSDVFSADIPTEIAGSATLEPTAAALAARQSAHANMPSSLQTGREVYEFRCSPCHGMNGEGIVGPSFRDRPLLTVEYVLYRVRSGPEVMSAFSTEEITDEQVSVVVDYLQAEIVGRDVPSYTDEQIEQGRALYREYCRECHAAFGQGKDNLGPAINLWPPMSISRIVEGGLLPLPNMPRLQVTPDELRLIAGFLYRLSEG